MIDFTLEAYVAFLRSISGSYPRIITFDKYFRSGKRFDTFCMIRHDVDRFPGRALRMAEIESRMGISSTYYFRAKRHTFHHEYISGIHRLGHEIGYHYECLTDAKGDMETALAVFGYHMSRFQQVVPVSTIAMHGRPFSNHDNRDMWKKPAHQRILRDIYGIIGEVYLDIDYSDILYITDTGRNWKTEASNRRDKVNSGVGMSFPDGAQLLNYFKNEPHPKLIFQVHPERWTDNMPAYSIQLVLDKAANAAKKLSQCIKR
jgi:hypothetical protein